MNFYNRNGVLYIRIGKKRLSTKMADTPKNRKFFKNYYKNEEFLTKFNLNTKVPTLIELCERVLLEKEITLKRTSYISYESLFNSRIKTYFKDTKVNDVTKKLIFEYFATFTDKSTLNICHTILKSAFEIATIEEYITIIPLVSKPSLKSDYEMKPFTLDEVKLILSSSEDMVLKNYLGIAFYTGMRSGEIFALTWKDIDFENFTLDINKTITKGFIQSPKTKSSIRIIDMLPQCEDFLINQRKITGLKKYVFYKPRGDIFKQTCDLYYRWKILLKSCSLDYRNIYQTRHTFVTNMLMNKEDLMWVSYMIGHKSTDITQSRYSKYIPRSKVGRKTTFLDSKKTQCV